MTAKEKAFELANIYYYGSVFDHTDEEHKQTKIIAKKHAIICVQEIIITNPIEPTEYNSIVGYWTNVIQEIKEL